MDTLRQVRNFVGVLLCGVTVSFAGAAVVYLLMFDGVGAVRYAWSTPEYGVGIMGLAVSVGWVIGGIIGFRVTGNW